MARNKNDVKGKYCSLRCVWMDAGVVSYKLCDMNFNCENCLFDKVMRNDNNEDSPVRERDIVDQKIEALKETGNLKGNIILKNNLMIKKLLGKTYYLGFTPLAYTLLENTAGFNYCREDTVIHTGDTLIQFIGDWGSIKILSPFNFYCLSRLKQELNDISSKEWFGLIELEPEEISRSEISEDNYLKNCTVAEALLKDYHTGFPNIGATLNDGGERIRYIYEIMGNQEYYNFLNSIFSQK